MWDKSTCTHKQKSLVGDGLPKNQENQEIKENTMKNQEKTSANLEILEISAVGSWTIVGWRRAAEKSVNSGNPEKHNEISGKDLGESGNLGFVHSLDFSVACRQPTILQLPTAEISKISRFAEAFS